LLQLLWRFRITVNLGLLTTALEVQNYKKFSGVRVVSISTLLSDFRSARIQHSYDAVDKGRGPKKNKKPFEEKKNSRRRRSTVSPADANMDTAEANRRQRSKVCAHV
jgi:hypothetical protein